MKASLIGRRPLNNYSRADMCPNELTVFGHDEEVGVRSQAIARHLQKMGSRLWILDEALVTEGIVPGVEQPVAYIGLRGHLLPTPPLPVLGAQRMPE